MRPVKTSKAVRDPRHKKSPPDSLPLVTSSDGFVKVVLKKLKDNRTLNKFNKVKEGEPDYLIDSHAALARAVTKVVRKITGDQGRVVGETQINNIIGPARPTSKWKRSHQSPYVTVIADLMGVGHEREISVPADRAAFLEWFAKMDDEEFAGIVDALAKRHGLKFG